LLTGLALLSRRYVPLMLVVSFPIAITTFVIDAFIIDDVAAWLGGEVGGPFMWSRVMDLVFFGGAVLAMHGYLMVVYLPHYRPMCVRRADFSGASTSKRPDPSVGHPPGWRNGLLLVVGIVAVVLGILSTGWLVGMIDGWLISWSS